MCPDFAHFRSVWPFFWFGLFFFFSVCVLLLVWDVWSIILFLSSLSVVCDFRWEFSLVSLFCYSLFIFKKKKERNLPLTFHCLDLLSLQARFKIGRCHVVDQCHVSFRHSTCMHMHQVDPTVFYDLSHVIMMWSWSCLIATFTVNVDMQQLVLEVEVSETSKW